MNIGEVIIAAVIRAAAIERAEHPTPDSTIFVWASNAEEQIEAALNEAGYTLCPNGGTQRPGTPDGPLATETRKPGSLK